MGDKAENRCYSRSDMMRMRDFPKSRTRPIVLSDEFNNEDGLFSPDKWLQHRWQCEGVESRPPGSSGFTRKKTSSRAEEVAGHDLEAVVLSPQRRGFFSGCRAPSPKTTDDDKTIKSRWRLNNGVDFKPSFQKNPESNRGRFGNNSVWRNNANDRLWNDKSNRRNNNNNFEEKAERIPEWVDEGPSSMTDVIELKGFDDDVREKKPKRRRNRDSASKSGNHGNIANMGNSNLVSVGENNRQRNSYSNSTQGSRPSSRLAVAAANLPALSNLEDKIDNDQRDDVSDNVLAAGGELSYKNAGDTDVKAGDVATTISLPNSDAEFAALLGITDVDPTSIQKDAITMQTNQPSSSRLSRFFVKTSATSEQRPLFDNFNTIPPSKSPNTPGVSHYGPSVLDLAKSGGTFNKGHNHFMSGDTNYPSALKELFMAVQPRIHTPTIQRDFKEGMTVEELERGLAMKMHGNNSRPLMPMPAYHHHNPSFHHHSVNSPHPNTALSNAKLAAMQAIAPQNEQFFAAFHQHMQQHFQRMGVSGGETPGMESAGSSKFPFDVHHPQQRHFDGRGPNSNGSSFMPTSVLRQLSMPPAGSVNRPLFDNCNMNPPCKSPHTPNAPHCVSSVFDMAKSGATFNRSNNPSIGGDSYPSALKELFTAVPPRHHTPTTPRDFKEGMTVEELERDLAMKMHGNGGRPLMPMPYHHHNPSFHHHSVNSPHPNAALSNAKLAAMQAIAPPNEQFFAAFHQHMQQHFQRMGVSDAETPGMESAGSSKFPFDVHPAQQQHFDGRGPNSSSFMPTSVLRQLSIPPAGSVNNSPFAADQQQLNLAIMRGDSEAAQQIRARMIAQVHAFAGLNQQYQE